MYATHEVQNTQKCWNPLWTSLYPCQIMGDDLEVFSRVFRYFEKQTHVGGWKLEPLCDWVHSVMCHMAGGFRTTHICINKHQIFFRLKAVEIIVNETNTDVTFITNVINIIVIILLNIHGWVEQ